MIDSLEKQLANWISERIGIEVTYSNDENIEQDVLNTSHGVLRIQEDNHGVNDEVYTEEASYIVEYVISEEDNEAFLKSVRNLALTEKGAPVQFEDDTLNLSDGISGKFYFDNCIQSTDVIKTNGEIFYPYELTFSLNLFEDLIPSDDLEVILDGKPLKGVISCVPSYSFEKEGFVCQGETLPSYEPQSKTLVITISYLPLNGNDASNFLINKLNSLSTTSFSATIKWPSDKPILHISGNFFLKDLTLNLVKGSYGASNAVLVKENNNG